jgi:hypothetical protein
MAIDQVCAAADAAPRTGILPIDRCRSVAATSVRRQRNVLVATVDAAKSNKTGVEVATAMAKTR